MWMQAKLAFAALVPNLRYRVATPHQHLYLTFDDGPHPHTEVILEVLARHGARATFFVLGDRIPGRELLLRRIRDAGHALGSHSYSHRSARQLDTAELCREQQLCVDRVRAVLPQWEGHLYRPPYGHLSRDLLCLSRDAGFDVVLWSKDAVDYRAESVEAVRRNLGELERGDILLFHDQFPITAEALDQLIPEYQARGFSFEALQ